MKIGDLHICPTCKTRHRINDKSCVYCIPCRRKNMLRYRARVICQSPCRMCGKMFDVTMGRAYNVAYGWQKMDYCGHKCYREASRVWPLNPRGLDYCRAPVPGGCDGLRCPMDAAGSRSPFCQAHKKRKYRGVRMDTPIARRK